MGIIFQGGNGSGVLLWECRDRRAHIDNSAAYVGAWLKKLKDDTQDTIPSG
jgi:hypothetical protein